MPISLVFLLAGGAWCSLIFGGAGCSISSVVLVFSGFVFWFMGREKAMSVDRLVFSSEFSPGETVFDAVLDGFQFVYEQYVNPGNLSLDRVGIWSPQAMQETEQFAVVRLALNNGRQVIAEDYQNSMGRSLVDSGGQDYSVKLLVRDGARGALLDVVVVDEEAAQDFVSECVREVNGLVLKHSRSVGAIRWERLKSGVLKFGGLFAKLLGGDARSARVGWKLEKREVDRKTRGLLG